MHVSEYLSTGYHSETITVPIMWPFAIWPLVIDIKITISYQVNVGTAIYDDVDSGLPTCYRVVLLIIRPHASDSDSNVCKAWRTNRAVLCNWYLEFITPSGSVR